MPDTQPAPRLPPALRGIYRVAQWGFVVHDLEAAMLHWAEVFGVGPWVHVEQVTRGYRFTHRGVPTDPDLRVAFAYFGDTQIELIQQLNDAPTPYREFLAAGREGMQHLAMWAEDYDTAVAGVRAAGYEPVYEFVSDSGGRPTAYYSAPESFGVMLELGEAAPGRMATYALIRAMAERWDGTTPVRRYRTMAEFIAEQTNSSQGV